MYDWYLAYFSFCSNIIYQTLGLFYVFLYAFLGRFVAFFSSLVASEFIAKKGIRPVITIGAFLHVIFISSFSMIEKSDIFIWLTSIFYGLQVSFYWIPANTDIAMNVCDKTSNRKMFIFKALGVLSGVLTPLISSLIVSNFGYNTLFLLQFFYFNFFYFLHIF